MVVPIVVPMSSFVKVSISRVKKSIGCCVTYKDQWQKKMNKDPTTDATLAPIFTLNNTSVTLFVELIYAEIFFIPS